MERGKREESVAKLLLDDSVHLQRLFLLLGYLYNHPFACQTPMPFSSASSDLNHSKAMNHCL